MAISNTKRRQNVTEWAKAIGTIIAALLGLITLSAFTSPGQWGKRIEVLEEASVEAQLEHAGDDETFKHYNFRLDKLDESFEKVDNKLDRLLERTP